MKVLLLKDVEKLGAQGEVVVVKSGYGRNFLLPQGLAVQATPGRIKAREEELRQQSRKLTAQKDRAQSVARQLETVEVVVQARAGSENRIFGSITAQQVADALAKKGFDIERRRIELSEEIRMLGVYNATAKLHPEVAAPFKVRVEAEGVQAPADAAPVEDDSDDEE